MSQFLQQCQQVWSAIKTLPESVSVSGLRWSDKKTLVARFNVGQPDGGNKG